MTPDEAAFQAQLDAHPDDHVTRLVLADWLDEQGDPRAEGYRALGLLRRSPHLFFNSDKPVVWDGRGEDAWLVYYKESFTSGPSSLPDDWFNAIGEREAHFPGSHRFKWPAGGTPRGWHIDDSFGWTADRRAVDEVVVRAFLRLPAARRAELLQPAGVPA